MDKLAFDFGKRGPSLAVPLWRLPMAALAAACMVLAAANYAAYRDALHAWQLAQEELAAASEAAPAAADADDEMTRVEQQLRHELSAPWEALLQSLEAAPSDGVALLEISADSAASDIVLTAEARDAASMHAYLQALGAVPGLTDLHLAARQALLDTPVRSVRFSANANWRRMQRRAQ